MPIDTTIQPTATSVQPGGAPIQPGDATQPQPPPPPDPDEDIKDGYIALYQRQKPSFETALTTPVATILAAKQTAAEAFEDTADVILDDTQRTRMAGKRYPELDEVGLLFASGLDKHPEIVTVTQVNPALLRSTVAQDNATVALVDAGAKLSEGGGDGTILAAATAQTLATRVLGQVKAAIADKNTPPQMKIDLEIAFAEPFRLLAAQQQAPQQTKAATSKAAQPQLQQATQAQQAAAETKLIAAYQSSSKQNQ